jgi:hypothetical protein
MASDIMETVEDPVTECIAASGSGDSRCVRCGSWYDFGEPQRRTKMIEGSCHCGAVHWQFAGTPESATACNCTICRRYGALWIYDYEDGRIGVSGPTRVYIRGRTLGYHFCADCGCIAYWRALAPEPDGRRRIAVNVRLSEPETVGALAVEHFDGLKTFEDLGQDGRCVADMWF